MTTATPAEKRERTPTPKRVSADPAPILWMTAPETAVYLGIHINHLRTIPPARLPYYTMAGRLRRYRMEDIEAFLAASRVDA